MAMVVQWVDDEVVPRLLTYAQAGRYIGMSESYIKTLVRQGSIPVVRFGRNKTEPRIDILDLDTLIEEEKAQPIRRITPSRTIKAATGERLPSRGDL